MLRETALENASDGEEKDVEVLSEPPEPVDTSIFNPPLFCCGWPITVHTIPGLRKWCCLFLVVLTASATATGIAAAIAAGVTIDCDSKNSSMFGCTFLVKDMFL